MKKLLTLLVAAMVLVGCSSKPATPTETPAETEAPVETTGLKVGIGSVTSIKVADASEDKDGQAQFNTTFATVVLEGDVIKYVSIDTAQNTGKFSTAGAVTAPEDPTVTPTKKEKGADYGMLSASAIGKEWFEQIEALEAYAVGKTVAEVVAMPTVNTEDHDNVPDVEELKTTCTMSVGDYLKAIQVAADNAVAVENVAKVGTGSVTSLNIADATEDKDGQVQANTSFAVVALDADGKIVYTSIDTAQNAGKFNTTGVITAPEDTTVTPTKKEKGADYGMLSASEIGKEWFEQIAALEAYAIGKTPQEIIDMPTFDKGDGNHTNVPDVEELKTTCTMTIGDYQKAIQSAANNAVEIK
ncbi:hypothetical protein [Anaerorhabdus sp.]|uniref:hypothetical protein n=1 Tax=Anaerorhabdus sp. TaxID=1872524 RepID=UPI002FC83644